MCFFQAVPPSADQICTVDLAWRKVDVLDYNVSVLFP